MILAALACAAQLANPGFERELEGWQTDHHRGMDVEIGSNRGYTIPQAAEGEQFLVIGWRARNSAPPEAEGRAFQRIDASRYRGRLIRVSVMTKAPDFADRNGSLTINAAGVMARVAIAASEGWRRHAVRLRVPRDARWLEVALAVEGTAAELSADDVRLDVLR
jgi:hypothetical protein